MKNKVAIVTGGSRGIGAATAKLLAENGYAVCINYLATDESARKIVTEIEQLGGTAIAVKADISKEDEVLKLFAQTKLAFGRIDALVNNAGTTGGIYRVEEMPIECLQSVFATNVFGTFLCCREAVKHMKEHGGNIVNISSEAARFGGNKLTHYAASKAAINAFTIGFAREIAQFNIRVNTISPGVIDTDIHANSSSERIQALKNSVPMGRMGAPEEVAETIVWLMSDKASYLSGTVIPVAGGR